MFENMDVITTKNKNVRILLFFKVEKFCRNIRDYEYFSKNEYFSRVKTLFHLIQILRTYIDAINFIFSSRADIDRLISTKCTVQTFLTFNARQYENTRQTPLRHMYF